VTVLPDGLVLVSQPEECAILKLHTISDTTDSGVNECDHSSLQQGLYERTVNVHHLWTAIIVSRRDQKISCAILQEVIKEGTNLVANSIDPETEMDSGSTPKQFIQVAKPSRKSTKRQGSAGENSSPICACLPRQVDLAQARNSSSVEVVMFNVVKDERGVFCR
jgi:hypothetical protein